MPPVEANTPPPYCANGTQGPRRLRYLYGFETPDPVAYSGRFTLKDDGSRKRIELDKNAEFYEELFYDPGQDIIVSHLQNALRTGGVSHAYILNGAKGSGRHMIARSFSAALLCDNPRQEGELLEPCGECLSCIQTEAGSNPDLITVEREKESSIGVGDIRRMMP